MINRILFNTLAKDLKYNPAVALLGPRQAGKTTLALELGNTLNALYLDLESPADLAKLAEPELYLNAHQDRLLILDEVHRVPGLFPILRGMIDKARRKGIKSGQYLLLGSASLDLLKQSGETLAGRIAFRELTPLLINECTHLPINELWLRGGFPDSLLSDSDQQSMFWRTNFIRSYLERDIPQLGPRIASETLRRFWTMLAHHNGGLHNAAQLSKALGIDAKTVSTYADLLVDLFLVRRLSPWSDNTGKRLIKSPKLYIRDSGIVHALLGIETLDALHGHPVAGSSWEGFVIDNIMANAPEGVQAFHYRSSGGAELDLLLLWPSGEKWAIEIKRSLQPKPGKGFYFVCDAIEAVKQYVVYPGEESFSVNKTTTAIPLQEIISVLRSS